jgi:acetoin:2,6-dichlorophenolindophenol oxidoreductase subunit beta
VGGEIAALIAEQVLDYLDAPVRRVAALDTPLPFNLALEDYVLPDEKKIAEAVRDLMKF